MDDLKKYVELCDAQQRYIDNYARVINALKDDFDRLQGAVLAEREACAQVCERRIAQGLNFEGCAATIRARGNA